MTWLKPLDTFAEMHTTQKDNDGRSPSALGGAVAPTPPEASFLPNPSDFKAPNPWVRLTGHLEGSYSLAIVNRGLSSGLLSVNPDKLSLIPFHARRLIEPLNLPGAYADLLATSLSQTVPEHAQGDAISVVSHYPFISDEETGGQRGILFFWEETAVPGETVEHLNAQFDLIWVAAQTVKLALINSGCHVPIFVIPIGVDHLILASTPPIENLHVAPGQRFRFLHISSVFPRKGPDALLAAYLAAFTGNDAVELYIKTFPNPHNQIHALLQTLSAGLSNPPRVVIDEEVLDDDALIALYRSAHAMVLPTRGEGFNLPAAEAMAMGLPVITTRHSAQADYCCVDTASLVNATYERSESHVRSDGACWLSPAVDDLIEKMKAVRSRVLAKDKSLEKQLENGRRHVRQTYRWEDCAQALLNTAAWVKQKKDELAPQRTLRLAVLSPWGAACGIAEYTQSLMAAFRGNADVEMRIFADTRTTDTAFADNKAQICWSVGDTSSVCQVLSQIQDTDSQVLLIQHQPSLFELSETVCDHLRVLEMQGRTVILELHSTEYLLENFRLSLNSTKSLMALSRIVVHKPEDINNLMSLGLADNVMLLPLGVMSPVASERPFNVRQQLEIPSDALVIGSFGMALPHKGIDTLVEAIKPLTAATGRDVYFVSLNAAINASSKVLVGDYKRLAERLGVNSKVRWVNDYLAIDKSQTLLTAADYIVYPYAKTRESVSGAVTIGISALRPVLVSPNPIFSDTRDATKVMSGSDVEDIVNGIQQLETNPGLTSELVARQRQWLATRDWGSLSSQLLSTVRALVKNRELANAIAPAQQQWREKWNANRRKKLVVDITALHARDEGTGIQRVVRDLLAEFYKADLSDFDICTVYGVKGEGFRETTKRLLGDSTGSTGSDGQQVHLGLGDVFLGLDLSAHLFPEAEQHLRTFRLSGASVHYVIYDLIPLRHPAFCTPGIAIAFDQWLQSLARCADSLICISKTVARDLTDWLDHNAPESKHPLQPKIKYFHLGADFRHHSLPWREALPHHALLPDTSDGERFLMVGTIEPRKGHAFVLDAFETLWAQGSNANLVIVGKQGWRVADLVDRIQAHPQLGKRLIWLSKLNDADLERAYNEVDCLVAASEVEGFGLPLIEAAQRKLPVIARYIPVFREIAGSAVHYFESDTPSNLSAEILEWTRHYKAGTHPRSSDMRWQTWGESAACLLKMIIDKP